ncbi:hypothetical protein PG997_011359 [Apiospora hydei]|uniref:FAD dependent oxidoreductase domain-containing protein n=1 Tax=Apiospora hydei TaxID=1337664 RepID=A0ABR1VIU2_9PEZI
MAEKQTATPADPAKLVTGVTKPGSDAILNVDEAIGGWKEAVGGVGVPEAQGQSLSYWLQQVRCDELISHRTTEQLPEAADTVIIGSGPSITKRLGPIRAWLCSRPGTFCSGATGRNAGHCKPDQWRGFGKYEKQFGAEQAMKSPTSAKKNVDCDLWVGDTLDVPLDAETAALARDVFDRYRAAGGKVDHVKVTADPAEARRISRLAGAQACYAWPAATLQPRKLVAHVMGVNLAAGVNLQTFTPVRRVSPYDDTKKTKEKESGEKTKNYRWTVHTDRGAIACVDVVHASNAYLPAYEPSLRGLIRPKPHMCNKVIPPLSFAGSGALRNSYGVLLRDGSLFSINPRYGADGVVMVGGSNPGQLKLDEWVAAQPAADQREGTAAARLVTDEVRQFAEAQFDGWRESAEDDGLGPGAGYEYSWSGIIGVAADGVPFVGEMPGPRGRDSGCARATAGTAWRGSLRRRRGWSS